MPADQRASATVVLADDFAIDPEGVAAAPGDRIVVVNDDIFYHSSTIDDLGIDVRLLPGDEALVELPDDATGSPDVHHFDRHSRRIRLGDAQ